MLIVDMVDINLLRCSFWTQLVSIMGEFLSFTEFKFVESVRYCCNMCAKHQTCCPFYIFLIPNVERYSGFIIFSPVFYCICPFFPKRNPMEGIPLGFYAMGSSLVVVVLIWVVWV